MKYISINNALYEQACNPISDVTGYSRGHYTLFYNTDTRAVDIIVGVDSIYCKQSQELYKGEDSIGKFLHWLEGQCS
jgi:hypothetical protein